MYIRCRRSNTSWKRRAGLHGLSTAQDPPLLPPASGPRAWQGGAGLVWGAKGEEPRLPAIPLAASLVPIPTPVTSSLNEQGHLLMAPALGGEEQSTFGVIGPGLIDAESHGPRPVGAAVPVGMTWEGWWVL